MERQLDNRKRGVIALTSVTEHRPWNNKLKGDRRVTDRIGPEDYWYHLLTRPHLLPYFTVVPLINFSTHLVRIVSRNHFDFQVIHTRRERYRR